MGRMDYFCFEITLYLSM